MITLTEEQEEATQLILNWFYKGKTPRFVLGGCAGSGKTVVISNIRNILKLSVNELVYLAYTGKASMVMRRKGLPAITMHKWMYIPDGVTVVNKCPQCKEISLTITDVPVESSEDPFKFNSKSMLECSDCDFTEVVDGTTLIEMSMTYGWTEQKKKELKFRKRTIEDMVVLPKLIIVDEASMINEFHQSEIESYGIKVLYVGDSYQLKPIKGVSIVASSPDYLLTKIHRQAESNSIIQVASMARNGIKIPFGKIGNNVWVCRPDDIQIKTLLNADQVICGKNDTRRELNEEMREALGRTSCMPEVGDKVICTRNNWNIGIVNGQVGKITDIKIMDIYKEELIIDFTDEEGTLYPSIKIDLKTLLEKETVPRYGMNAFQYGYVLSCHKSQGSEYDKLVVFEEQFCSDKEHRTWQYTAITRASKQLILLKK